MGRNTKETSIKKVKGFLAFFVAGRTSRNLSDTCAWIGVHNSVGIISKEMGLIEKKNGTWKWAEGNGIATDAMAAQVQELSSQYANAKA